MGEAEWRREIRDLRDDLERLREMVNMQTRGRLSVESLFPMSARITSVRADPTSYDWILRDKDGDVAELTGDEAKNRSGAALTVGDVVPLFYDQKDGVFFFCNRNVAEFYQIETPTPISGKRNTWYKSGAGGDDVYAAHHDFTYSWGLGTWIDKFGWAG